MQSKRRLLLASLMAALTWFNPAHAQDTFKIGFILPMTGPFASTGKQVDAAVKLFMQQNGATVAGRQVQITLPGGELTIEWRESDGHVLMTGGAEFEFEGRFDPSLFASVA